MSETVVTLYSTNEAAQFLKVGSDRARELARSQRITSRKIGRRYFFTAQDLNTYLNSFSKEDQK